MTFWDKVAGVYDIAESLNGKVYTEMCDITKQLIPEGAKVLDCAAGTGELTFAAAEKASSVLCTDRIPDTAQSVSCLPDGLRPCKRLTVHGGSSMTFSRSR